MSTVADGTGPSDDSPSTLVASSPSTATPPRRPLPGQAGEGDESEVTTTQPPRFTTSQAASTPAPVTTSDPPPVATTSNPPPPPSPTTTSSRPAAVTTRPSQPDPSPQATASPANTPSPSPTPAVENPSSPQTPTSANDPNSPTSLASSLLGVNNIVSPTNGAATALGAVSPLEIVSILSPSMLPDGSTTTIALAPDPVLLTPSASQGFVTATRSKGAQATDGVTSPTGTGDSPHLTPSEKRGRDSAQITGIA